MATADKEPVAIGDILAKMRARKLTPEREQVAYLSGRAAFLAALEHYPIDNRRVGETFRDTFTVGETCKPHPPRSENMPFQRGTVEDVIDYTLDLIEADYPGHIRDYGEMQARLVIVERFNDMEKARREGRAVEKKGGARKAGEWNL